jgi:F0F1-type ATP synthase membrane subunit b/b'
MLRQNIPGIDPNRSGSELTPRVSKFEPERLELVQQVQRLEEMIILDGVKLPLTGHKLVNEEQLLNQLTRLEQSIPETVQSAEKILLRQEDMLTRANDYAQELIKAAEQRAAQIADEMRIVQQAEMEAQELRQRTQQEANALRQQAQQESEVLRKQAVEETQQIRRQLQQELDEMRRATRAECQQIQVDADKYADRVLSEMERQFQQMLQVLNNGRQHLRNTQVRPPS